MKRNIKQYLIAATAAMLLAGCDVKDPIFNTAHPDHGVVTLITDWSNIGTGITAPTSYVVSASATTATASASATSSSDAFTATVTGNSNRLDHLFSPGPYHFLVYNIPAHITVSGTTATVESASGNVTGTGDNATGTGGFINNAPGWLFSGTKDLAITQDTEHSLTVPMQQQVRQLTLIIAPTGGTTERIEHIEGYLSGVASKLDVATGTHADPLNVELSFAKITEGADAGKWSATVHLLGIAGTQQKLNISIRFTGGSPSPVIFDSSLTEELASFNSDKRTPLVLGGQIVETPTGAGFIGTIIDWVTVNKGEVTAQ